MPRRVIDDVNRLLQENDNFADGADAYRRSHAVYGAGHNLSAAMPGAGGHMGESAGTSVAAPQPEGPNKLALFTNGVDDVDFNLIKKGQYDPAYYYNVLGGNDYVYLPDADVAAKIDYNAKKFFFGATGNDFIFGGNLDDLIDGGQGNDELYGGEGKDVLIGGLGQDRIYGENQYADDLIDNGDLIYPGFGIDIVAGGSGNDIIIGTDDDGAENKKLNISVYDPFEPNLAKAFEDHFVGGAGNDIILASSEDWVAGDEGDDIIIRFAGSTPFPGTSDGGNGNDTIVGCDLVDIVHTGFFAIFWPAHWNAENKADYGGFHDTVDTGGGNDLVTTMYYCDADVKLGDGDDNIFVVGMMDHVEAGRGNDELSLFGGACQADMGSGDDIVDMMRPSYDNPNVSLITLGEGKDTVQFSTDEWMSNYQKVGESQSLKDAPLILDFDTTEDAIGHFRIENADWPELSLKEEYIKVVAIQGGSAIVYDEPNNAHDFCFARFQGVDVAALQANFDQNATFGA